ncbi:MAG: Rieske 2Fe-2S domain-containing protein [Gemmatimonadota bacterium]|nr:Rieske 2Fe-2S domain-containing protein [Gemmatimonadota bacterium]
MKTRASYKSHPLHPALIPFPFAFLVGGMLFDLTGRLFDQPGWWETGYRLVVAGLAAAVIAAVPGIVDYRSSVPPHSSAKKRATRHLQANLASLALFTSALVLRGPLPVPPGPVIIALEIAGAVLLSIGGWMGGTLINRNMMTVDHRYANTGRWKESWAEPLAGQPVEIGSADELERDQMKLVHVGDRRIVLGRTEKGWVAFDDGCTHRGASLADGILMCGKVQCLWHGSQFDVVTGAVCAGPAERAVRTYTVEEADGKLRLVL